MEEDPCEQVQFQMLNAAKVTACKKLQSLAERPHSPVPRRVAGGPFFLSSSSTTYAPAARPNVTAPAVRTSQTVKEGPEGAGRTLLVAWRTTWRCHPDMVNEVTGDRQRTLGAAPDMKNKGRCHRALGLLRQKDRERGASAVAWVRHPDVRTSWVVPTKVMQVFWASSSEPRFRTKCRKMVTTLVLIKYHRRWIIY